jgi:hypothetical protein
VFKTALKVIIKMDSAVHFALLPTAAKLAIPPLTVEQVKTVLLVYLDSISNILELQVLDSVFSILNAIMDLLQIALIELVQSVILFV